jgi:hypothetical protein
MIYPKINTQRGSEQKIQILLISIWKFEKCINADEGLNGISFFVKKSQIPPS